MGRWGDGVGVVLDFGESGMGCDGVVSVKCVCLYQSVSVCLY